MIIIKAYEQGTLTKSQQDVLFTKAKQLKLQGYTHMYVAVYTPAFSGTEVLEYVAINSELTQRAFVGKKGGLSNVLGQNNEKGYGIELGNSLEMVLTQLDKYVTVTI